MSLAISKSPGEDLAPEREFSFGDKDFKRITDILYEETGIFMPDTKASLVYSRLAKRLRVLNLDSFKKYCAFVVSKDGEEERQNMLAALTTNVTRFFREPHHFEHLKKTSLPPLLERAREGGRVRIWSAGCSNGSEPYSIAMMILSALPDAPRYDIKILASDIDTKSLKQAREGVYSEKFFTDTPAAYKNKYLHRIKRGEEDRRVCDDARSLVRVRHLNLNGSWPMKGNFDIIFCRNVVIYFNEETQAQIWSRYSAALNSESWLYIGHSERLSGPALDEFRFEGETIYRKIN